MMVFSRKDLFSWDSCFEAFLNRQKGLPCPLLHPCAPASPPSFAAPTSLPPCKARRKQSHLYEEEIHESHS